MTGRSRGGGKGSRGGRGGRQSRKESTADLINSSVLGAHAADVAPDEAPCLLCGIDGLQKMIQCVTCKNWVCTDCAGISEDVYIFMSDNKNCIWCCVNCSEKTLETLETGAQIQLNCKRIEKKLDDKIDELDIKIAAKADKATVDLIKSEQITHTQRMDQLTTDISKLRATIDLVRNEPVEKVRRSNNLVIRGIPESADLSDSDIIKKSFERPWSS